MWICTKDGFVSVVQHKDDPDVLMVRGRRKEHVTQVLKACGVTAAYQVKDRPADYAWRGVVTRFAFNEWLVSQSNAITYLNFKNEVKKTQGDTVYYRALMRVWAIMRGMTPASQQPKL